MIAVSQNLALGIPVAIAGAGGVLAENTGTVENGFLDAFVATGTAVAVTLPPDQVADSQAVDTVLTEKSSVDAMFEAALVPSAIWQPFLQVTPTSPAQSSGAATPEIAAKPPSPASGAASGAAAVSLVADPSGDAPPKPASPALDQPWPGVFPQTATTPNQNPALPAPMTNQRADLAVSPADTVPEGAMAQAAPPAHPTDQQSRLPRAAGSDAGLMGLPPPAQAQYGAVVSATQPSPADPPSTPSQNSKDPQSVVQLPADATKAVQNASAVENAWRQKWLGAGDIVPEDSRGIPAQAIAPGKAHVPNQTVPPTGWIPSPIAAAQTAQSLAKAAPLADGWLAEKMLAASATAPVIKNGPEATPAEPASAGQPMPGMSSGVQSLDVMGFGVAASAGTASHDAAMGLSPAAPVASAPPVITPPVITPTIIDMVKTGNDGPVDLTLSPEELGRLTISLKRDGDFVHVTVIADRPETLDLMRRHAGDLIADLRQAGFSGASLNFGQGGKDHQAQGPESTQDADTVASTLTPPPDTRLPNPGRSRTGSGVDLRL